ncbi:MAG: DUF4339 domain-containing protein, partial [Proteobacteria bacterium]
MIEPQKIWFVYLVDHHEGPFLPSEVAVMVSAGTVTAQTLGWKDGMAEWIPIESIPELKEAIDNPPAAFADAGAGGDSGGDFSLAEMLAKQQGASGAGEAESEFSSGADALASLVGGVNQAANTGAAAWPAGGGAVASGGGELPAPHEEAWTMRVGSQVSGLFSLNQLQNMAASGDVPPHALLWHSGWTDFQPLSTVPELANAAQSKRFAGGGNTLGGGIPGAASLAGRKPVFAPITS